jgi:hypothetical protein
MKLTGRRMRFCPASAAASSAELAAERITILLDRGTFLNRLAVDLILIQRWINLAAVPIDRGTVQRR